MMVVLSSPVRFGRWRSAHPSRFLLNKFAFFACGTVFLLSSLLSDEDEDEEAIAIFCVHFTPTSIDVGDFEN